MPVRKVAPDFKDVMVDLETYGKWAGCGIVNIGAVAFDPKSNTLGEEFYTLVNKQSCIDAGLHINEDTMAWWNSDKVSDEARKQLKQAEESEVSLKDALLAFDDYLAQFGHFRVRIWGCGSNFDNPIIEECYRAVGLEHPWRFWNDMCYRTIKTVSGSRPTKRHGTYHNALDDAKTQAIHLMQMWLRDWK